MLSSTAARIKRVAILLPLIAVLISPAAITAASHARISKIQTLAINHGLGVSALFHSYSVIELGTLGGTTSIALSVNNRDWVVGAANLRGDQNEHAVLWTKQQKIDLGTLGGPNSAVWPSKDDRGEIVGPAETSTVDSLREGICLFGDPTPYICRGFVWRNGVMTPLQTLGGPNSFATWENNRGQIAGFAESVRDPSCIPPQVFDIEAVIWGPHNGQMQELRPLAGDRIAAALSINDLGQVVGTSGACMSPGPGAHAVLWQDGSIINLGSLGGTHNNIPFAINNRGQVVGSSDLRGDATSHAFLWEGGAMTDLGTLSGDFSSNAGEINDKDQIGGQSCDQSGNCRAFLWQDGVMVDLNALIPPGSPLYLMSANDINSEGAIVGQAFDQRSDLAFGFVAFPNERNFLSTAQIALNTHKVILPERVRKMLQHQCFGRFAPTLMRGR